ncbi:MULTISPECIES: hypothetical protein [unclassified Bradyrhizobium]|uniref:hypothetical protein n=1 Tax=unclassified Bradyrhizobium TaxID=2631580 RepID=UPI0028EB1B65|nr:MULTISPECIES: hypothetical protein [unclassified Bradyrhizobium]
MFMVVLLWAEVEAQRCAATLPVGETWGSKGKGGLSGGGSPAWQGRANSARLHAPDDDVVMKIHCAEDRGYRSGRHGEPCFTLARARAEPLEIS